MLGGSTSVKIEIGVSGVGRRISPQTLDHRTDGQTVEEGQQKIKRRLRAVKNYENNARSQPLDQRADRQRPMSVSYGNYRNCQEGSNGNDE